VDVVYHRDVPGPQLRGRGASGEVRRADTKGQMFLDPDDMWNADATRCWRRNQRSGLVQKRKLARKRAGEASLPEVLDRLELALIGCASNLALQRPSQNVPAVRPGEARAWM